MQPYIAELPFVANIATDLKIFSLLYTVYELKDLNEQLPPTHEEITTKENVVTHHTIVAEEAISGP